MLASLEQQLLEELVAEGVDVQAAAGVEDDGEQDTEEVAETGYVDEQGELRRPWCPQTRILEHREMVRAGTSASQAPACSATAGRLCTTYCSAGYYSALSAFVHMASQEAGVMGF